MIAAILSQSLPFKRYIPKQNRSDVIRTRDLYVPNVALYQAEPHSVFINYGKGIRTPTNRVRVCCATITPFRIIWYFFVFPANKYYYTCISKNCKHFFNFFLFFCFFLQFPSFYLYKYSNHPHFIWVNHISSNLYLVSSIIN